MGGPREVEIKFALNDVKAMEGLLKRAGFRRHTSRSHEMNTLFDVPSGELRARGEVLRLREYGNKWTLTHKTRGKTGRHKSRIENETEVANGSAMNAILNALGYRPAFYYEKFRSEWTDGTGHVLLDETPIGNFGEIEGAPRWIDRTARSLHVKPKDYVTDSYVQLFSQWKERTGSGARHMTFKEVKGRRQTRRSSPSGP